LCWQTVEQQFIPALAIASAVSTNYKEKSMKTRIPLLFILLIISIYSLGENINFIVKAEITTTNNLKFSGYFVNSFPIDFKFEDNETLEYVKAKKDDSLFLSEIRIISDGNYIFKFTNEYEFNYRFGMNEIASVKVLKTIIDPQPPPETVLKPDAFKILCNPLNKIQFISCSDYYQEIPLNFIFISFSSDSSLNNNILRAVNYLKESAKTNNIQELMTNIDNLETECIKDNILFLKEFQDSNYYKFSNLYNVKFKLDYRALNNF
jgi:hypothetical protein